MPRSTAGPVRVNAALQLAHLLAIQEGQPTIEAQLAFLTGAAQALEPLRRKHRLPDYALLPGPRLRRLWGRCKHFGLGRRPEITIRCTSDTRPPTWRRPGAIVATLIHEMAHLRYASHGPRFWGLHRVLLDEAQAAGLYSSDLDDVDESSRGAEKLAGSAGQAVAEAAATRRRDRAARNLAAAKRWAVGDTARVTLTRGALAGVQVKILSIARSWLTVETPAGKRYRVAGLVLGTSDQVRTAD